MSGEVTSAKVAEAADCGSYAAESTEELFVRELGKCSINGSEVSVYTFADNGKRDDWLKAASSFGGKYLVLDKAILTSDTTSALDTAEGKVGGELK